MQQARPRPDLRARVGGVAATVALPVLGGVLAVALWWAAVRLFVEPGSFLAAFAPDRGARALADLLAEGALNRHVAASLKRILVGLLIAAAIGIPFGLALGGLPVFNRVAGPVASFVRMVSPLSWTPLAIIWFGVGDQPVYFLIAIGAVWPIALSTSAGVAALDPQWLMLGRSLRATPFEMMRTIVWPGIRSDVLTGLRLALTTAWIILVPAEMLGVDSGLGYFILDSRDRFAYSDLVAAIVVIGALGFVLDRAAHILLTPRRRAAQRPSAPVVPGLAGAEGALQRADTGEYRI
ncbi:MAG: ABC transporter permease [Dehalococcoidia bacterium]|nr:ABC transporter permease [Dehalococcoidia bacterium]